MNKSRATIETSDTTFKAQDDSGMSIDARFDQQSDIMPLSAHPAFGAISDLLDMSFVTRRSGGAMYYNAFNLELAQAYIAPVSGRVRVTDPNAGGFPNADRTAQPLLPLSPEGLPGAFRIWCSWSMTNPLDSKRIRHAAEARAWLRRTD
jgi:hypothetical protein